MKYSRARNQIKLLTFQSFKGILLSLTNIFKVFNKGPGAEFWHFVSGTSVESVLGLPYISKCHAGSFNSVFVTSYFYHSRKNWIHFLELKSFKKWMQDLLTHGALGKNEMTVIKAPSQNFHFLGLEKRLFR